MSLCLPANPGCKASKMLTSLKRSQIIDTATLLVYPGWSVLASVGHRAEIKEPSSEAHIQATLMLLSQIAQVKPLDVGG